MSYIEKLLDGATVEWKTLGDVADYVRGLTYNKSNESDNNDGYRVLRANNITLSSNTLNFDDVKVVKSDTKVKSTQKLYENDILISAASGSREHVGKVAFINTNLDYYFGGFMGVIRCSEFINSRFLFHILTGCIFQKYLDEMLNSSTINNLNSTVMNGLNIPIPPLHVQEEIVRILDAFTELTAELTTELTTRKKQYEYYRDKLLTFDDSVEWKTLGAVTLHTNNVRWRDADRSYRYIDLTSVSRENNSIMDTSEITADNAPSRAQKLVEENDVIFATTRPTQQRLCIISREFSGEVASTGYCVLRAKSDKVLPKWIFYFISSSGFKSYVEENQSGSAYPAISDSKVKEFIIPIPSLEEQERIVAILDKFDALTNSITEGLPREIELRKQQYEYYRDMLLSFPKPEVA